jgi:hypothetical protein
MQTSNILMRIKNLPYLPCPKMGAWYQIEHVVNKLIRLNYSGLNTNLMDKI